VEPGRFFALTFSLLTGFLLSGGASYAETLPADPDSDEVTSENDAGSHDGSAGTIDYRSGRDFILDNRLFVLERSFDDGAAVFISFEDAVNATGFDVRFSSSAELATGFVGSDRNAFILDVANKTVLSGKLSQDGIGDKIRIIDGELYVEEASLQVWLSSGVKAQEHPQRPQREIVAPGSHLLPSMDEASRLDVQARGSPADEASQEHLQQASVRAGRPQALSLEEGSADTSPGSVMIDFPWGGRLKLGGDRIYRDGAAAYLPMRQISELADLNIYVMPTTRIATGHYRGDNRAFILDADKMTVLYSGKSESVVPAALWIDQGEIYVRRAEFETWFNARIESEKSSAGLTVSPPSRRQDRATESTPLSALSAGNTGRSRVFNPSVQVASATTRINPFGRAVEFMVPLRIDNRIRGSVPLRIEADDTILLSVADLAEQIKLQIQPDLFAELSALANHQSFATLASLSRYGIDASYNSEQIEIELLLPSAIRGSQEIRLSNRPDLVEMEFEDPADFSGFLNVRTAAGFEAVGSGQGVIGPGLELSLGMRTAGLVLESDFIADFENSDSGFERLFTRIVRDDLKRNLRISAGDVFPRGFGYAASPDLLGISIERRRRLFNPQENIRLQSFDSFALERPAKIDVLVNGVVVRDFELAAGNYTLSDLPLGAGANEIQVIATDNFGRREIATLSRFLGATILDVGESEFSFSAGIQTEPGNRARSYDSDRPTLAGNYRRGINDSFTAGIALQGDRFTQALSLESNLATRAGTFLIETGASQDQESGFGYAARGVYQYSPQDSFSSFFSGFSLAADYTSEDFSRVGRTLAFTNIIALNTAATTAFRVGEENFVSLGLNYATLRQGLDDRYGANLRYSRRVFGGALLSASLGYAYDQFTEGDVVFQIGISRRLGERGFGSTSYSSRNERLRANYAYARGRGTGAYSAFTSAEIGRDLLGVGLSGAYSANRAELGLGQSLSYDNRMSDLQSSRTSLQFGSALVFADGVWGIGRPINDSFAIVRPHSSLRPADIYLDRSADGYFARSGALGPAVKNELGSYSRRTVLVDVPDAPLGYDIGSGAYQLRPDYKSGYVLTVGSEYSTTIIGRLLNNKDPVVLATGRAERLDKAGGPTIEIYTNRSGRFGATGLSPGRWRITMNTRPILEFVLDIPEDTDSLLNAGDLEAE
jgi:outer membrane usher protein